MRHKLCFDFDWKFFLADLSPRNDVEGWGGAKAKAFNFGATAIDFDDSGWRHVTLPHDFVLEGDYTQKHDVFTEGTQIPAMETINSRHFAGGSLAGGVGWYRKRFDLSDYDESQRIYLHFDGVFRDSYVYLNEYFIGRHSSGYTSFFYDITDFVNYDKPNVLAVRVDATGREGWWYEGGGIYRHVWLEVVNNIHIAPWGIFVSAAPDFDSGTAQVRVETELVSKTTEDVMVTVESLVLNSNRETLISVQNTLSVSRWCEALCVQNLELTQARLWDLDAPYLYMLQSNIYENNKLTDTACTYFGVREIVLDPTKGLHINRRRINVNGLCAHHDHAGVGIAVPDRVFEYRLERMKEMGCNAYRCAHNPPTPEFLHMCDRMGILVMDETRQTSSAVEYLDQLRAMVKRDRNHPSIFVWSIGNEEVMMQFEPEAARIARAMRMEVKKLDHTRPTTLGGCFWSAKKDSRQSFDSAEPMTKTMCELDAAGINYSPARWDEYHALMPRQPLIITEASSNSGTRGCYATNPLTGGYYIMDTQNADKAIRKDAAEKRDKAEEMWKLYAEREYMNGYFIWTAFDYRGEPSPMRYPAISTQFGIMDYCGFRKDNFYYYKSWWTEEPVLHIFPHWNWQGQTGLSVNVYCYSNMDEVELFVNGQSQGRKKMDRNWYLEWVDVIYQPGTLSADGYRLGAKVITKEIKTTGEPVKIELRPDRDSIIADGRDVAIIEVRVLDAEGLVVPTANNQIFFDVRGSGEFLGVGNGNPGSHESDKQPFRRVFNGLCQLLVRSGFDEGEIVVAASATGLESAESVITTHS
jgi:beta-galactosidase